MSIIAVVLFVLGAAGWFFIRRRRRPARQHDEEPFEKRKLDGGLVGGSHYVTLGSTGSGNRQAFRKPELDGRWQRVMEAADQKKGSV